MTRAVGRGGLWGVLGAVLCRVTFTVGAGEDTSDGCFAVARDILQPHLLGDRVVDRRKPIMTLWERKERPGRDGVANVLIRQAPSYMKWIGEIKLQGGDRVPGYEIVQEGGRTHLGLLVEERHDFWCWHWCPRSR